MLDPIKVAAWLIADAARCIAKGGHEGTAADRWVKGVRGLAFPVSFDEACQVAGVDADYTRRKLYERVALAA